MIGSAGGRLLRTRWVVRGPLLIYRARLGVVFGSRLLMLEHLGRTSGARRHVVLEVVDHPRPDTYVVASGFGETAQWFRNVLVEPHVRVSVGRRVLADAVARRLPPDEARAALASYASRHPRVWRTFEPVLANTSGGNAPGRVSGDADPALPMVEIRLG